MASRSDNRTVTSAKELPRRLLVLGGGAVGVEMAQAFKRLGCEEVVILEGAGERQRDDRTVEVEYVMADGSRVTIAVPYVRWLAGAHHAVGSAAAELLAELDLQNRRRVGRLPE